MSRGALVVSTLAALGSFACAKPETATTVTSSAPSASVTRATASASARAPGRRAAAAARVDVPAGAFSAGSLPGEPERRPELEARRVRVELGGFAIDRLPFPNEPGRPPRTGVTRQQARELCAAQGARLCTELEWERACRGPENDDYAGAPSFDPRCVTAPESCASGFDVLAMGGALREWTANDVRSEAGQRGASVRGAPASAASGAHRCAARRALPETESAEDLGFRCCRGAPNAAIVAEAQLGPAFQRAQVPLPELTKLLEANERTRELARELTYFREPDAARTVVERGPGDKKGFDFTVAPLRWSPVAGAEFLLVIARSGKDTSFVAAWHVLGDGGHLLAASFVMRNEPGPVAFAYSESIRPRLHFSTCWGCSGETGKLLFREPEQVSLTQP